MDGKYPPNIYGYVNSAQIALGLDLQQHNTSHGVCTDIRHKRSLHIVTVEFSNNEKYMERKAYPGNPKGFLGATICRIYFFGLCNLKSYTYNWPYINKFRAFWKTYFWIKTVITKLIDNNISSLKLYALYLFIHWIIKYFCTMSNYGECESHTHTHAYATKQN